MSLGEILQLQNHVDCQADLEKDMDAGANKEPRDRRGQGCGDEIRLRQGAAAAASFTVYLSEPVKSPLPLKPLGWISLTC